MDNEKERIIKELISKEEQLLDNNIRNDAGKIAEIIDDSSIEINESGKLHNYRRGELFGNVDGQSYIDSNTVKLIDISDDCKLLLYISVKVNKNARMKSSNSSIWKRADNQWKIVFHQVTNCS